MLYCFVPRVVFYLLSQCLVNSAPLEFNLFLIPRRGKTAYNQKLEGYKNKIATTVSYSLWQVFISNGIAQN